MKLPKRIDKLIDRRTRLAEDLNSVDLELTEWLEKKGIIEDIEEFDYMGGCEMYVNPCASADRIKQKILSH